MFRTALSETWGRKRRLFACALSVILGVGFLTATLVFGDSAGAAFRSAFAEANAGTDAVVRSSNRLTGGEGVADSAIDAGLATTLQGIGAVRVAPVIEGVAQIVGADGTLVGGGGPPTLGTNWIEEPELNPYRLVEGRAPRAAGEIVIDRTSATDGDLEVGATTTVLAPRPVEVSIVGIATFGDQDSLGGVTLAAFTLDQARDVLLAGRPQVTRFVVAAVGERRTQDQLAAEISASLPEGVEVITGDALTAEQEGDIDQEFLGAFRTALVVFAVIALLVSAFSIFNTFSILSAQRTRESALLRTLGASRGQVLAAGLLEAAAVGVVGSALGLLVGVGMARLLQVLLEAAGFGLPVNGLDVRMTSALVAMLAGVVVTLIGGTVPAWRSSSVAPLAALRALDVDGTKVSSRRRLIAGAVLGAGGAVGVLSGGQTGTLGLAAVGALAVLAAVVLAGPVVAGAATRLLGWPLRWRGAAGDLAARNAARNPRRTAATAASLLVGISVVSLFAVFGASAAASIEQAVNRSFAGDLVVQGGGWSGAGLSPEYLATVRDRPEVGVAAGLGFAQVTLDGSTRQVGFADLDALVQVARFDVVDGDLAAVTGGSMAASEDFAKENGWELGRSVTVGFPDSTSRPLRLAAIYGDSQMGGAVLLPDEVMAAHSPQRSYAMVFVQAEPGVTVEDAQRSVASIGEPYGRPAVRDREAFVDSEAGAISSLLSVIYGLLGIAIVIALMSIANTLSLSVHERRRELGLLRAVGLTRRQLRTMVRWESVVVSTFGAAGGLGLGVFLGWGLFRTAAESMGSGAFALPVGSLAIILLVGAGVGVLAALRPAWRAARLDVLEAISST